MHAEWEIHFPVANRFWRILKWFWVWWWWLHKILRTTELYTLKRWVLWYMHDTSILKCVFNKFQSKRRGQRCKDLYFPECKEGSSKERPKAITICLSGSVFSEESCPHTRMSACCWNGRKMQGNWLNSGAAGGDGSEYMSIVKWSEVKSLSRVRLFATPWTVSHQAPPSMGFSRQEYWSGLPFPSPGDLPNPGIKPRYMSIAAANICLSDTGYICYVYESHNGKDFR